MVAMVSVGKLSTAVAGSPRDFRVLFSAGRFGAILVHNMSRVFLLCWWSHLGYGTNMSSCGVVGSGLVPGLILPRAVASSDFGGRGLFRVGVRVSNWGGHILVVLGSSGQGSGVFWLDVVLVTRAGDVRRGLSRQRSGCERGPSCTTDTT